MRIHGIAKLTPSELDAALQAGGRFVFFEYCISLIFISLRRASAVYFLPPGRWGLVPALYYSLVSLLLGWWGVPWGVIYTPLTLLTNLSGGRDVTPEVYAQLRMPAGYSE
jgi:hypothetical protein